MGDIELEGFKKDYPDLYAAIFRAGENHGKGRPARMENELGKIGKLGETESHKQDLPVDERAKAAWDSDPALRSEFSSDYSSWLAYFKADENGQVHILGRKEGAQ